MLFYYFQYEIMAECKIQSVNSSPQDDEKLEYIGNLVTKIESLLSPKPINVWHFPGALQRILSSVQQIFNHGCKTDPEGNHKVWSFIFGLRVICPDLWPTYELRSSGGNLSNDQLVSQWLELSLQSHLLSSQLKALFDDRKRLHASYHSWAFLRTRKYTDVLLIVLQALERNSQDILATLNPSLMVKFYSQKKKSEGKQMSFSVAEGCKRLENKVYISSPSETERPGLKNPEPQSASKEDVNSDNLSVWNENYVACVPSKLSPSFFNVDYSNAVSDGERNSALSDGERNHSVKGERSKRDTEKEPRRKENGSVKKYSDDHATSGEMLLDASVSSYNFVCVNEGSEYPPESSILSSLSNDMDMGRITKECSSYPNQGHVLTEHSEIVKPSAFLLKYLASKSKIRSSTPNSIMENAFGSVDEDSASEYSLSNGDSRGAELKPPHDPLLNELGAESLHRSSLPSITTPRVPPDPSKAYSNDASETPTVVTRRSHIRSHSDGMSKIVTTECPLSKSIGHVPVKGSVRKRFMEDGGQSITPEADGFFPHPQPGQNLLDFLTSAQFSKTSAQLDRENAHFNIAEAVLAAIEQMNFDSRHTSDRRARNPVVQYESEEDLSRDKRLPANRRRLRVRSRVPFSTETSDDDPVTTDYSVIDSPEAQSSEVSDSESLSIESPIENVEGPSGVEDDLSGCPADPSSAENIAIAILRHYNSRLLPKASELQWLVSEQEAPQKLLPMPNSVAISPDDAECQTSQQPLLRGTLDWAPPRPQLILTLHKNTKRKARLIAQKWRCAGCGLVVSEKLSGYFRLCHYLGRFFCTNCHTNKKAVVPAKVLHKWDFNKYAICNFSSELLSRMSGDPLFHIGTLNPRLYKQSRDLHQTLIYRLQLFHARVYIFTCSRATKEKALLEASPLHWSTDPHVYSMEDLLSVRKGPLMAQAKTLTTACVAHISHCQICLGQGFICEICRQGSPIFPFQLDAVTQCTKCKECFHFLCFNPHRACPRCERRERRESKGRRTPETLSATT